MSRQPPKAPDDWRETMARLRSSTDPDIHALLEVCDYLVDTVNHMFHVSVEECIECLQPEGVIKTTLRILGDTYTFDKPAEIIATFMELATAYVDDEALPVVIQEVSQEKKRIYYLVKETGAEEDVSFRRIATAWSEINK